LAVSAPAILPRECPTTCLYPTGQLT
jgi:hypothetical protein